MKESKANIIHIDMAREGSEKTIMSELDTLSGHYKHVEWCNECRDWFDFNLEECPDCEATNEN